MSSKQGPGYEEYASAWDSSMTGVLRVISTNRKTGFVSINGIQVDIFIPNEICRNRAIHGDLVAIQILPSTQWQSLNKIPVSTDESSAGAVDINKQAALMSQQLWQPSEDAISERFRVISLAPAAKGTSATHPIDVESKRLQMQPTGKVIAIVDSRHSKSHIGCLSIKCALDPNKKLPESQSFLLFQPHDAKYPFMRINRNQLPAAFIERPHAMRNHIFIADLADWPKSSESPFGANVRSIGEMGSIQTETEALLLEHNLNHGLFSDECLAPLQQVLGERVTTSSGNVPWCIPPEEIARRRDLRSYRIFTIDPPTAKDLDDALHITQLDEDTFEIGVHIADVSYFLLPDTALDAEAQFRATSVYLVQRVIPMLPNILCEELCSLNPNVDRLAFSCIWKMKADGTMSADPPWFGRTVIRSCAKLDYPTAQRMIDGIIPAKPSSGPDPDAFLTGISEDVWEISRRPVGQSAWGCAMDVVMMASIARKRRVLRLDSGALVLTRSKLTFRLDADGNPIESSSYVIRESNSLVEEYMLLANYLVAQELLCRVGPAAFLRCHPPPDTTKLDKLKTLGEILGVTIDVSSAMGLQKSLTEISRLNDPLLMQVVTSLLTQPMNPAQYFVANNSNPDKRRHYALSIPYYTHFTSPIRRYADVMVHRLLAQSLEGAVDISDEKREEMNKIATQCNEMKAASKAAQDRSDRVFLAVYLDKQPTLEEGVVIDVGVSSFTVLIPKYGFDLRLYVNNMVNVESEFDEGRKVITLRKVASKESRTVAVAGTLLFETLDVHIMKRLKLLLRSKKSPPIDVEIHLVGAVV